MIDTNELCQNVGAALPDWVPPPMPPRAPMQGRYCRVEPLDIDAHAADLHRHFSEDADGRDWSYLPYGPFDDLAAFEAWLKATCLGDEPLFFVIVDTELGAATGMAAYLNIKQAYGTVEVGHIHYAPALQNRRAATEAMYLMMGHAFDAGYRRYEWKCNDQNRRSRAAAQRYGFSYEGIFRQHMVVRGHNRDSAWYACIDGEWPGLKSAFETWLDPQNFAADGTQKARLSTLTRPILVAIDPETMK